ncbi:MAG: ABC transporter substrate-binding protein [bacterium]|nr:ABC transporter substrate-binding protein [bacterium]
MRRSILLLTLALIAAACSGSGATTTVPQATTSAVPATTTAAPTSTAAPVTTAPPDTTAAPAASWSFTGADGVTTEISDTSRIVALNGDITEILFELGIGDSVAAIDVTTTFPEAALQLPVVGFGQMLAPEGVLAFNPTLIIGDQQVGPPETIQQLRDAGFPVVIIETQATLAGVATKIGQIAEIVGQEEAGVALAERISSDIAEAETLAASVAESPKVVYLYVRGPQTLLLFGMGMPTQAMIEGAGAIDGSASTGVFGAAPVTPEALIAAAPDVIVLPAAGFAALGGEDALLAIPGIAETPAGQEGAFLVYDEAYFFNLGPRTAQALTEFIRDLYPDLP